MKGKDKQKGRKRGQPVIYDWSEVPLMARTCHVRAITGWGRTYTYDQLRNGRLAEIAQRWDRAYLVPREALRQIFEGADHDAA